MLIEAVVTPSTVCCSSLLYAYEYIQIYGAINLSFVSISSIPFNPSHVFWVWQS